MTNSQKRKRSKTKEILINFIVALIIGLSVGYISNYEKINSKLGITNNVD